MYKIYLFFTNFLLINSFLMKPEEERIPGIEQENKESRKNIIKLFVPPSIAKIDFVDYLKKKNLLNCTLQELSILEKNSASDLSTKNGISLLKALCNFKREGDDFLDILKNVNGERGISEAFNSLLATCQTTVKDFPEKTMGVQNAIKKMFETLHELVIKISTVFVQDVPKNQKIALLLLAIGVFCFVKFIITYFKKDYISPELQKKIDGDFLIYLKKQNILENPIIEALKIVAHKEVYDKIVSDWLNYSMKAYGIANTINRCLWCSAISSVLSVGAFFYKELLFGSRYLWYRTLLKYKKTEREHEENKKKNKRGDRE